MTRSLNGENRHDDGFATAVTRPILPSADFPATVAFYETLGFDVTGQWPDYLIISGPDGIQLHFWHKPDVNRWTNDVACWIGYPSVNAVRRRHAAWSQVRVPPPAQLNEPLEAGHLVEFQLIDLHGNLLRIGAVRETPSVT